MYSTAATGGGEGDGGTLAQGLFGSVNVEAVGAEWYRSQVTQADLAWRPPAPPKGQPIINYDAVYPVRIQGRKPILKMLNGDTIVHTDLNAIITGPNKGRFPAGTLRPIKPNRSRAPFREFTVIYHDEIKACKLFRSLNPTSSNTRFTASVMDSPSTTAWRRGREILANRLESARCSTAPSASIRFFILDRWRSGADS